VRAVPGEGLRVPVWILGSSLFGAQLAAALGLPFAFASHFAPDAMMQALEVYRSRFKPSERLDRPHAMLGLNVFVADTDVEAVRLFSSLQQAFARLRSGRPGKLPPPVDDISAVLAPVERATIAHALRCAVVGSPETVRKGLKDFVIQTGADELMVTAQIFDHGARMRSFELLAGVAGELGAKAAA